MYIRITSRCNMTCAHCCYNCTNNGEDMSLETWGKAMEMSDGSISLGGGEPTLHPQFWQMLGESIGDQYCEYVWLATNGSQTRTAIALAGMAKAGVIGCALSQDPWHDEIDERVVEAFTRDKREYSGYDNRTPDAREIRDVSQNVINGGRCDWGSDGCVCPDLIIEPDGTIRGCGCDDAPTFGTVYAPEIPDDWEYGECTHEQPEEEAD